MNWNNFTSYSEKGDNIIRQMIQSQISVEEVRKLFSHFIKTNGYVAFHIHDGWVMHNHRSGSHVLDQGNIRITWIDSHARYSHTARCPEVGEKMVVVPDMPYDGRESSIFDIHCYEVIKRSDCAFSYNSIELKKIEVKKVKYDHTDSSFTFHSTVENIYRRLIKKIK